MPRSEEISVSLVKSKLYDVTIQTLRQEAKELQQAFGSIKVGDSVKALKDQATASKEVSKAAQEVSKAEKEAANAEKARYQAIKELENATKAHLSAQKEAQGVVQAQIKTEKEAYNAIKAKEQAEKASIQTQKAQISLTKQQTSAHKTLGETLRTLTLQYVSLHRATQTLRYALSEMKDMSDAMAEYRKVSGATVQEMERIRDVAYSVGKAYGQSASDVIASSAEMVRAGYKETAVAMAELATKTQLVGDMNSEAASKFLIAVDAAYKYKGNVEQLTAVLDAANEIDNNYATTIEKISEGMTLVSSLAASAHVPIEQLMAALGTMTAITQRSGSETARGLRSVILNVMGDTTTEIEEGVTATEESVKSMTDALMRYGDESIKAAIKAKRMINPMEAIVALQKAWKNNQISEADLFQISNDVAGKRYYNVFTALIQNPDMYNSMLESIATSAGSAKREVDILMDSWTKKLEKLKTTWTELVNKSIKEGYIKWLIDAGTATLSFVGSLENLIGVAGGALISIRALSAGFRNLSAQGATQSLSTFGMGNLATGVLGLAVTGVSLWKSAYENRIRQMQEEAAKTVESAVASATTYNSLEELTQKYSEIASDGIQEEKGELEELKSLQDQLNGLVGDQATAIDIVNGKYGDTLTALKKLTAEQKETAKQTYRTAISGYVAAFNTTDLNGAMPDFITNNNGFSLSDIAGNGLWNSDAVKRWEHENSLYFKIMEWQSGVNRLYFRKPSDDEGIVQFYKELMELYEYIGSHTETGEIAKNGEKTIGEVFGQGYIDLGNFIKTVEGTGVKALVDAYDALQDLNEEMEDLGGNGGTADDASGSVDDLTDSVDALSDSIDKATKAKEKFDESMKTTKADAFGEYMAAFETFKSELNAGRVNSTAMYAAARMMLGTDAYNATGGTYAGVTAALNRSGTAGSVLDAYNMLNAKYVDANGNAVAGFGVYELIRNSGLFSESQLTNSNGDYYIPELTEAQVSKLSEAYGGILEEVIINALDALDQYDIHGRATDETVKIATKSATQNRTSQTVAEQSAKSEPTVKEQILSEREKKRKEEEEKKKLEEANREYEERKAEREEQERKEQEEREARKKEEEEAYNALMAKYEDAAKKAEETQATINGIIEKITELVENPPLIDVSVSASTSAFDSTMSGLQGEEYNADIDVGAKTEAFDSAIQAAQSGDYSTSLTVKENGLKEIVGDLNGIKERYDVEIANADPEGKTEASLKAISDTLKLIEENKGITISPEVASDAETTLLSQANAIIGNIKSNEALNKLFIKTYPDGSNFDNKIRLLIIQAKGKNSVRLATHAETSPASSEIDAFIAEQNKKSTTVTVHAETSEADSAIYEKENGEYTATIKITDKSDEFSSKIAELQSGSYRATICIGGDQKGFLAEINSAQSGEYTATITIDKKDGDFFTEIASAQSGPYTATIQIGGDPSGFMAEIEPAMSGDYAAVVHIVAAQDEFDSAINAAQSGLYETKITIVADTDDAEKETTDWIAKTNLKSATIPIHANTTENAAKEVEAFIGMVNKKVATITIATTMAESATPTQNPTSHGSDGFAGAYGGGNGGIANGTQGTHDNGFGGTGGGDLTPPTYLLDLNQGIRFHAAGTKNHEGGTALVNDGDGPELLVSGGRAFIANRGKPALVNLERGAKVFTASETRQIMGGSVPAYAFGTNYVASDDVGARSSTLSSALGSFTGTKGIRLAQEEEAGKETQNIIEAASKSFGSLKDLIEYIIGRIGIALDEQIEIIDKQISELKAQREAQEKQDELLEKQKNVSDALNERTVRYIDENGQWHWMADQNKVAKAQEDLRKYEEELAFNAKIQELEDQKTALRDQYKEITKAWSDIQYGMNTPTGDLNTLISEIISTGGAADKKGAQTVRDLLIGKLIKGGIFSANYDEALDSIAQATAGNPIMPGESNATLASLIATAHSMGTGTELTDAMKSTGLNTVLTSGNYSGLVGGGTQVNYNYFINGVQLGSDQANQPLSDIMRNLTVYANTGVA